MSDLENSLHGMRDGLFNLAANSAVDYILSNNQSDVERPFTVFRPVDMEGLDQTERLNDGLMSIDAIAERFETSDVIKMLTERYEGINEETVRGMMLGVLVVRKTFSLYIHAENDLDKARIDT